MFSALIKKKYWKFVPLIPLLLLLLLCFYFIIKAPASTDSRSKNRKKNDKINDKIKVNNEIGIKKDLKVIIPSKASHILKQNLDQPGSVIKVEINYKDDDNKDDSIEKNEEFENLEIQSNNNDNMKVEDQEKTKQYDETHQNESNKNSKTNKNQHLTEIIESEDDIFDQENLIDINELDINNNKFSKDEHEITKTITDNYNTIDNSGLNKTEHFYEKEYIIESISEQLDEEINTSNKLNEKDHYKLQEEHNDLTDFEDDSAFSADAINYMEDQSMHTDAFKKSNDQHNEEIPISSLISKLNETKNAISECISLIEDEKNTDNENNTITRQDNTEVNSTEIEELSFFNSKSLETISQTASSLENSARNFRESQRGSDTENKDFENVSNDLFNKILIRQTSEEYVNPSVSILEKHESLQNESVSSSTQIESSIEHNNIIKSTSSSLNLQLSTDVSDNTIDSNKSEEEQIDSTSTIFSNFNYESELKNNSNFTKEKDNIFLETESDSQSELTGDIYNNYESELKNNSNFTKEKDNIFLETESDSQSELTGDIYNNYESELKDNFNFTKEKDNISLETESDSQSELTESTYNNTVTDNINLSSQTECTNKNDNLNIRTSYNLENEIVESPIDINYNHNLDQTSSSSIEYLDNNLKTYSQISDDEPTSSDKSGYNEYSQLDTSVSSNNVKEESGFVGRISETEEEDVLVNSEEVSFDLKESSFLMKDQNSDYETSSSVLKTVEEETNFNDSEENLFGLLESSFQMEESNFNIETENPITKPQSIVDSSEAFYNEEETKEPDFLFDIDSIEWDYETFKIEVSSTTTIPNEEINYTIPFNSINEENITQIQSTVIKSNFFYTKPDSNLILPEEVFAKFIAQLQALTIDTFDLLLYELLLFMANNKMENTIPTIPKSVVAYARKFYGFISGENSTRDEDFYSKSDIQRDFENWKKNIISMLTTNQPENISIGIPIEQLLSFVPVLISNLLQISHLNASHMLGTTNITSSEELQTRILNIILNYS
ncbi:hypothetical protein NUSPORA_01042 [Nucleospora cyclopteri]